MITLDPTTTAVLAVDMHRGHLDPAVATLPLQAERCGSAEILANPFWKAIHDDPTKARKGMSRHNLAGSPGTEISPFHATDLEFVLRRRLGADTLILAGINTTSCVLCTSFEATNRDFRVIVAADAVDSMDGEEMHRFALRLMAATVGWTLPNADIVKALRG